ncbi:MAG: nuclear transport factor 2 family protein [Halobacteriota archaeon]|nr:nuclear transport factor 2 family protein [Halobacteriota archaeon]
MVYANDLKWFHELFTSIDTCQPQLTQNATYTRVRQNFRFFTYNTNVIVNTKETLKKYLQFLETSDYENLISLFSNEAIVHSPLYGKIAAVQFYKDLFRDTSESKLTLLNIFTSENEDTAAVHFRYDWTLSDGSAASFEVVDVCNFSSDGKIEGLKIIYDSAKTRAAFEKQSS